MDIDDSNDAVPIDVIETSKALEIHYLYGDIVKGKFIVENQNGDRQIIQATEISSNQK